MKNNSIAICVITFNRPKSLDRLLTSLSNAIYEDKVNLIISIDKNNTPENNECIKIAKKYKWIYGNKKIIIQNEHLGLKNHILKCGSLTKEYNNIILLEYDIIVSKNFFNYTKCIINFYKNNTTIAGYSLYSFEKNPCDMTPFYPLKNEKDTYFIQFASSWGQIINKKDWNNFINWYKNFNEKFDKSLPQYIKNWNENSWLKYYQEYLIENNKYFVYPYNSYATNCSDIGSHTKNKHNSFQVSLYNGINTKYNFQDFDNTSIKYDMYFENSNISYFLNTKHDIECDFYSNKTNYKQNYLLTRKKLNYKIIKKYDLELYPYEQNIINNIKGNDLYLYDLTKKQKNKFKKSNNYYSYIYKLGKIYKKNILGLYSYLNKLVLRKIIDKLKRI